ncbi:DMT family transporter [Bordetella petrii]|uniref:DMT family transporter n=1 Tax=Bordetella petrii TaxID=94624 RepID=UPI001E3DF40F|nr:DMT family transporter [Bordetella petrii]MCD0503972.1 DMT family transporter [Bordetella petrii]
MTPARNLTAGSTPLAGIACVSAGIMFLTFSDALAKWVGAYYSPVQILFLRAAIALPFVWALVLALGGRRALRTRHLGLHLVRGALNIVSATLFYLGLQALPLAEASAIVFSAPLFVTALSVVLLKERVDGQRWLAVAAGFAGVLVIVRPGSASFQVAALYPLATAVLYAAMMLSARAIGRAESMLTTMFYIVAGQLVCSAVAAPAFWTPLQGEHLPYFAGIALFSTLGLTFITQGFRIGPASVVAPFDYSGLLWASLLGWLVWRDVPDLQDCLGAVFIVGSGIYIAWREARPAAERRHRR